MAQHISFVALVVRDYDEAKKYYCEVLGFKLIEDIPQGDKRWVIIAPPGGSETRLVLQKAINPEQTERVGNQTGGRVFLFLQTDDFDRDFKEFQDRGVRFIESPREEEYGMVVKFEDLYINHRGSTSVKSGDF